MNISTRLRFLLASIIIFIGFIIIAFLTHYQNFDRIDQRSMVHIQSLVPKIFDPFLSLFSILGSFEFSLLYLLIIFSIILIKEKRIFFGIAAFFIIMLLELIGKLLLFHPGPPYEFFRNTFNLRFPSSYIHTNYSFPSGHAARAAFIIALLVFLSHRWIKKKNTRYIVYLFIFILSVIIFTSRISLGEHWFSDVLGGMFLGFAAGLLSLVFY